MANTSIDVAPVVQTNVNDHRFLFIGIAPLSASTNAKIAIEFFD